MKHKTERGDRGDRIDVLTKSGDGRRWPDFEVNGGGGVQAARPPAGSVQGGRVWLPAAARRGRARRARESPLYRGAGQGEPWARTPRQRRRPAVAPLASGRWATRGPGGLEQVGPSGSAHSSRIGFSFFRIYF
jgi:hypothetical protein